ncbi:MAG: ParM/StbA family protein [Clostridium sp.]
MELAVIDLGSFNIKSNKGLILENRFIEVTDEETFGTEYIEFQNRRFIFGKGEFDKTFNKTNKDFITPLLYGLGKSGFSGDVNLILHLPSNQMPCKAKVVDELKGKEFEFILNGNTSKIKFNRVGVLKEGWSSFYSLQRRNEGLIAIIDIGGRTTDIFTFNNGIQEQEKSLPLGMMNVFSEIADILVAKGENRKLEDIHKLFKNNIIDKDDFNNIFEKNALRISNNIKVDIENLQDYKIYITGGGAEFLSQMILDVYPNGEILRDSLCSNCNGSHIIGKAKGFEG